LSNAKYTIWSKIHLEDLQKHFPQARSFKPSDELVFIAGQQSVLLYIADMLTNKQSIPVETLEGISLEEFKQREVLNRNFLK
jgi:hypothetical protein